MKKKTGIIIAILSLAIGFAAVSTTLIINGSTNIKENTDDYSVIFTKASLDGVDVYSTVVDDTKKVINFTTSELKTLNQTSILNYEVTNNSNNYDAEVSVTCVPKGGTTAKYTSIKNELVGNATKVLAKESVNGTLIITLNQTTTEEVTEEYTCTLEFNAVERDTIGETNPMYVAWIPTYFEFGTPTTSSVTDYTTLNKDVFAGLGSNDSKGVCVKNEKLFCIRANDFDNSVGILEEQFGETNCDLSGSEYQCNANGFNCSAYLYGKVSCSNIVTNDFCEVSEDGSINCA